MSTDSRGIPEVIVDFTFDRGILHVAVVNVSDYSAFGVAVGFDTPFRGLGGSVDVSALPLFRRVEFLAPHKRIETLLDASAEFFARGEPTTIGATVSYNDGEGSKYERRIVHNLEIYRDVSYLVSMPPAPPSRMQPSPSTGNVPHGNRPR